MAAAVQSPLPPQKPILYVGDLDPRVTESDLVDAFCQKASASSIKLCRSATSRESLCYGFVIFQRLQQAMEALSLLNHSEVKGKEMRLMWFERNPTIRKSGVGNLFVKNLHSSITSSRLDSIFKKFGTILSCKVAEENGKGKGFGFVHFDSEESAIAAQTALHGSLLEGKKLHVSQFAKKCSRVTPEDTACRKSTGRNLYVKNLSRNITEDELRRQFGAFGKIVSVAVMKDERGRSRGFGFVEFELEADARSAMDALHGSNLGLGSKALFVARAQTKDERREILKNEFKELFVNHYVQRSCAPANLFVKNLDQQVDDDQLRQLFGEFGKIISAKVMLDENGVSKRFGFVCFSNSEEAITATNKLHGTMFQGKALYVATAQSKKERYLQMQNRLSLHLHPPPHPPSITLLSS